LDGKFVSRDFNAGFIAELPKTVDPCGENGEFPPSFTIGQSSNSGSRLMKENISPGQAILLLRSDSNATPSSNVNWTIKSSGKLWI
jgi:hypothetical protein